MEGIHNIEKLNRNNYTTWKFQVKASLEYDGLVNFITGEEVVSENVGERRRYNERRAKALGTLKLTIDDSLIYLIPDTDDPKEIWKKLQNTFQAPTWNNKVALKNKLYNLKYIISNDIHDHLKDFSEIFTALAINHEPIKEEEKVSLLISSLPPEFQGLLTALEVCSDMPSYESLSEKIINETLKLKRSEEQSAFINKNIQCR